MAIARRSVSAIVDTTATTFTLSKPTGTVSGDFMFAVIWVDVAGSAPSTLPTGWSSITTFSSTVPGLFLYRKVAGGSEPTTYSWSGFGASAAAKTGAIATYTGVDTVTPSDTITGAAAASSKTSISAPSITTVTDGALVITSAAITAQATASLVSPTTPAGIAEWANSTLSPQWAADDYTQAVAGATGTFTFTPSLKCTMEAFTIALRPASSGTTYTKAGYAVESA